jgi:uncharacterized protein
MQALFSQITIFTTVFLGIFIEAVPFLLLGTVASGLVEVFVSREDLTRLIPRNPLAATLVGGIMGFAFPVCECGVVPLTRRLFAKGLPVSAGIAFLLAAPIVNPVVLASTYAAYGWGSVLLARFGLGLVVACVVGMVFSFHPAPMKMMRPQALPAFSGGAPGAEVISLSVVEPASVKLQHSFRIAADEFFEMGRYLIIGSMLAALMQTVVPQSALLAIGSGPVSSVLVMQMLAFVLSVCSTVDAFLSLAFVRTFTTGSILSFLIFGPMVDIKSTLMILGVFKGKTVLYIVVLPFLLVLLIGIFINLNLAW